MVASASTTSPSTSQTSEKAFKPSPRKSSLGGRGTIVFDDTFIGSTGIGGITQKGKFSTRGKSITDENRNNSNRWSSSTSSLSRSSSDSSTILKARVAQHNQSASVSGTHIVSIRPDGAQVKSHTRLARAPTQSPSIAINPITSNPTISPPPSQPLPPLPFDVDKSPLSPPQPPVLERLNPSLSPSQKHFSALKSRNHKRHRSLSQRKMLSSALQKANTAVLLDNASNIEGAMEAYGDACILLQLAMERTVLEEDRRQLQEIHDTYRNRINQLKQMTVHYLPDEKELPARPLSQEYVGENEDMQEQELNQLDQVDEEEDYYPDEDESGIIYLDSRDRIGPQRAMRTAIVPPRRDSLSVSGGAQKATSEVSNGYSLPRIPPSHRFRPPSTIAESSVSDEIFDLYAESPNYEADASPQLQHEETNREFLRNSASTSSSGQTSEVHTHSRAESEISTSWLNTIDESGGSISGESTFDLDEWLSTKGRRDRGFGNDLDAAVDTAYVEEDENHYLVDSANSGGLLLTVGNEGVSQAEKMSPEIDPEPRKQGKERESLIQGRIDPDLELFEHSDGGDQARSYLDEFEFGLQIKSPLPSEPRGSSSSGYSGSTWATSVGSQKNSMIAQSYPSLDPVIETAFHNNLMLLPPPPSLPPPPPPVNEPLAAPSEFPSSSSQFSDIASAPPCPQTDLSNFHSGGAPLTPKLSSIRSRRLSGLISAPLKIEAPPPFAVSGAPIAGTPVAGTPITGTPIATAIPVTPLDKGITSRPHSLLPSPISRRSDMEEQQNAPPSQPSVSHAEENLLEKPLDVQVPNAHAPEGASTDKAGQDEAIYTESQSKSTASPVRKLPGLAKLPGLRHIPSSSSLRGKSIANGDRADSPLTPGGISFFPSSSTTNLRSKMLFQAQPTPPTPAGMASVTPISYPLPLGGTPAGGFHLLDSKLHSPTTPGNPNLLIPNPPLPLEPCPAEPLSRPYWLMRCLFQTLAHPRGGYISARLFVPRDVWSMKGVKIKAIDDKTSACDLVSAALGRLVLIQKDDATALFEEMQSLENVLDRVQSMLSKKLGNDVGAAGVASIYRSDSFNGEGSHESISTRAIGSSGKSYLSWRRLRTKGSSTTLSSSFGGDLTGLPMASSARAHPTPPQRSLDGVKFSGPNAAYASALAKIFDAAQALDEIQIDTDKLPRKIVVGLQLSQRHAAEFFGFYICRFVLADVSLLLDKFIKKGTEWVGC